MAVFKIRHVTTSPSGHVNCRLFVADSPNFTYAKCGEFTVRTGREFEDLQRAMSGVAFEKE